MMGRPFIHDRNLCSNTRPWDRSPQLVEHRHGVDAAPADSHLRRGSAPGEVADFEGVRHHGIAPVPQSHPAYRYMRNAGGDGVVCE